MAWGQEFEKEFFGRQGLKDYAHAAKTFLPNGYELVPRNKFLFHSYFNINTDIPLLRNSFPSLDMTQIGLMIKTIQLPKFTLDTETLNQYGRKRVIQKKINYGPLSMTFHDDSGSIVRNMWYNYYSYYYKDPSQTYLAPRATNGSMGELQSQAGFAYNARDIYANDRPVNDWGYVGESYSDSGNVPSGKSAFFKDITIYGLSQHKWVSYVLINPLIKSWEHDTYSYNEGSGTMQNSMTIEYETVKYYEGAIGKDRPDNNVVGFAGRPYYDTIPSSLARPGSTQTVLGQGGILDAGIGIVTDLQNGLVNGSLTAVIGAVQKAGTTYNTWKGKDIRATVNEEANAALKATLKTTIPGYVRSNGGLDAVFLRSPNKVNTTNTAQGQ
jgi:hypothetical protein